MGCGVIPNRPKIKQNSEVTKPNQPQVDPKNKYINDFELVGELGKGSFGIVYKIKHKTTNEFYAMKIVNKKDRTKEDNGKLLKEIEILTSLDHTNIVKLIDYFEDSNSFYLVLEYIDGIRLDRVIETWHAVYEANSSIILRQILVAVEYLHSKGVVHRDLKPENIFVCPRDDNNVLVKIIDFSCSAFYAKRKLRFRVGTPLFVAPEVLRGCYNEKVDEWSCGIILYNLLAHYKPFAGKDDQAIYEHIKRGSFDLTRNGWREVSDNAKDLVIMLLNKNAEERVAVSDALRHPWILRYDSTEYDGTDLEDN
jgi:calcium-dependent protein kinase